MTKPSIPISKILPLACMLFGSLASPTSFGMTEEEQIRANEYPSSYSTNELVVKFKEQPSPSAAPHQNGLTAQLPASGLNNRQRLDALFQKHRTKNIRAIGGNHALNNVPGASIFNATSLTNNNFNGAWVIDLPKDELPALKRALAKDPDVEYVEPIIYAHMHFEINDPFYYSFGSWIDTVDDLWGLKTMQLAEAWEITTGENIVVAVIDSGIDASHEDFTDRAWQNPNEICCNGIDDDNNGFVDDISGWDFIDNNNDPYDLNGHGTHVAGTIAAVGGNNLGIIGVAPSVKILTVRALNERGSGSSEALAAALRYAADMGAHVINNSWGGAKSQLIDDAVRYAQEQGSIVVASAGNSGNILQDNISPNNVDDVIVVGATNSMHDRAFFSNYGPKVDVMAPGQNILSLHAEAATPDRFIVGEFYSALHGTSMSAPHVSGLIALLKSQNVELTSSELVKILQQTSSDLLAEGWDLNTSYGNVNALQALSYDGNLADIDLTIHSPANLSPLGPQQIPITISTIGMDVTNWRVSQAYIANGIPGTFVELASGSGSVHQQEVASFTLDENDLGGRYIIRLSADSEDQTYYAHTIIDFEPTIKAEYPKDVIVSRPNNLPIFSRLTSTFVDVNNDGTNEMISLEDWQWTVRDQAGNPVFGSPFQLPHFLSAAPSFADLDNDGDMEIVFGLAVPGDEHPIYAYHHDGSLVEGFPAGRPETTNIPREIYTVFNHSPVISDVDGDGNYEIFANPYREESWLNAESFFLLLSHTGETLTHWNVLHSNFNKRFSREEQFLWVDINNNGSKELIYTRKPSPDHTNHDLDTIEIRDLEFNLVNTIDPPDSGEILDLKAVKFDNESEIKLLVVTQQYSTQQYYLYELDGSLVEGWPNIGYEQHIFSDINNDSTLEIVTFDQDEISVLDKNGNILNGYPKEMPEEITGRLMTNSNDYQVQSFRSDLSDVPIFVVTEIVVDQYGTRRDTLAAIDANGELINYWDKQQMFPFSLPAIGYYEDTIEINIINAQRKMFSFEHPATNVHQHDSFFTFKADPQRSSVFQLKSEPKCDLPSLQLRGDFNNWQTLAMACAKDNLWEAVVSIENNDDDDFKFDVYSDWTLDYGDDNRDGIAEVDGKNIQFKHGAGEYLVHFNDVTLEYSAILLNAVDVDFTCTSCDTFWGQNVYVVGNIPSLGSWNTANAIKLHANNYPDWERTLRLPRNENIQYKCIKKHNNNVIWESGSNHVLNTQDGRGPFEAFCQL